MSKSKPLAAAILLSAALSACAVPAPGPDIASFTALKPGFSTLADAVSLMGKPISVGQGADGSAVVGWLDPGNGRVAEVMLLFDRDQRFVRPLTAVRAF